MKEQLQKMITEALIQLKEAQKFSVDLPKDIQIEQKKDPGHGDFSSNIALIFAKNAGMNPRELADMIVANLPHHEHVAKVEVAGPGFINFFVTDASQHNIISEIIKQKEDFGRSQIGANKRIHIEYVSANPTGPLHVGHGRGAAFGAVASDLLEAVGYDVHREYYVNDAGRQMNILAVSVWLRYLEACGEEFDFPSNGYKGDYIRDIAVEMKNQYGDYFHRISEEVFKDLPKDAISSDMAGDKEAHIDGLIDRAKELLGDDYSVVHAYGLNKILDDIKNDLGEFGVHFQEWFSEKSLMESGAIQKGIDALRSHDYLYEKDGALWFKSTQFGDEKDRVLVRENGQTTYFASDVSYHWNKLERGFQIIIDVFGADHHGYVPRVKAAMRALGLDADAIRVPLVQFAVLYRGGQKVQMSTRSGEFVTLRQLREEVGNDAARFFYIMRKVDQHMDFDLDLAKSKTNENPVYYIQYAHARICSVFRQLEEKGFSFDELVGLNAVDQLTSSYEKTLLSDLIRYPEVILQSAEQLEPHRLANYLRDLATNFHAYYNSEQFIVDDINLRSARLCLIIAVRQVIQNGLNLLGVSAPEKM